MYKQILDPVGHSLGWSALVACLPLAVLFVLLGVVKTRAWIASLVSLVLALVIAIAVYSMPVGQSLLAASEGAAFGFFPILWIVINAVWIYRMTVDSGHFDVLGRSFSSISDDMRVQAVIITFCFGALLEALAGFGTPVAITSVMLVALGFEPIKAATLALVANTAPVAFGALAIPITTLSKVTSIPVDDLGKMVGRQTPVLAVFVPLALIFIADGRRGLRQAWPVALVAGLVFGVAQFATANYISVPLADVVAALLAAAAIVGLVRVWRPAGEAGAGKISASPRPLPIAGGAVDEPPVRSAGRIEAGRAGRDPGIEVARAYAPYVIIIAVFVLSSLAFIKGTAPAKPGGSGTGINAVTHLVNWPGLHVVNASGKPLSSIPFKLDYLAAAGTLLLISGLLTMVVLKVSPARALSAYVATLRQLALAIVTVMAVLALAFVMNDSGQTVTIGKWMAGAGGIFALLSPVLGWLGTAVTGSDTSSNSLFGVLQLQAASDAHINPLLLAAGNSSGGVLGKMISPQNLAIGAAAVGLADQEGVLFRKVLGWSLGFLAFMAVLIYLQSTSVLSWMIP